MAGCCSTPFTSNAIRDEPFPANSHVEGAMLVGIVFALFTILANMVAPALIVFQDCGPWQAMQLSLRAALANWRPVAVYGLLLFFCGGVVPGLAVALIKLTVPPPAAVYVTLLTVFPISACSWRRRRSPTTSRTATSSMRAKAAKQTPSPKLGVATARRVPNAFSRSGVSEHERLGSVILGAMEEAHPSNLRRDLTLPWAVFALSGG
jgi:xanthosine utilization system XapX-like protein